MQPLAPARHSVTFRNIRLLPFLVRVPRLPSLPGARTPRLASLGRLPVSNATRKIADAALLTLPVSRPRLLARKPAPLPLARLN
jgi:hypothetical protein